LQKRLSEAARKILSDCGPLSSFFNVTMQLTSVLCCVLGLLAAVSAVEETAQGKMERRFIGKTKKPFLLST
jgi:hypothetical protein